MLTLRIQLASRQNDSRNISASRRCLQYVGAFLAITFALAGLLIALTISIKITPKQKISWAAKFIKSIVQDLLINPLLTFLMHFIMAKISEKKNTNNRIRTLATKLVNPEMLTLKKAFQAKQHSRVSTNLYSTSSLI